jgi:hypothetical protein
VFRRVGFFVECRSVTDTNLCRSGQIVTCVMKTSDAPSNTQSSLLGFDAASREDRWRDDGGQGELYEEEPLSTALRYPLYLIANDKGVLVANSSGKDCVLLFHRKELAERHIAEVKVMGQLYPLAVPNAEAFRQGLESLPADINCAIWDATVAPGTFVYMGMNDLFRAIDD